MGRYIHIMVKKVSDKYKKRIKLKIIECIKEKENISTSEIIEKLNFDTWKILEALDELKKEGKIE